MHIILLLLIALFLEAYGGGSKLAAHYTIQAGDLQLVGTQWYQWDGHDWTAIETPKEAEIGWFTGPS